MPGKLGASSAFLSARRNTARLRQRRPGPKPAALDCGLDAARIGAAGLGEIRSSAEAPAPSARQVHLCQRKTTKPGEDLGKTTGWIHRTSLKNRGVQSHSGCEYQRIDERGLHLLVNKVPTVLEVDHVVVCAGQLPERSLHAELVAAGVSVHLIGGADVAAELDAKRAISQGMRLAAGL